MELNVHRQGALSSSSEPATESIKHLRRVAFISSQTTAGLLESKLLSGSVSTEGQFSTILCTAPNLAELFIPAEDLAPRLLALAPVSVNLTASGQTLGDFFGVVLFRAWDVLCSCGL